MRGVATVPTALLLLAPSSLIAGAWVLAPPVIAGTALPQLTPARVAYVSSVDNFSLSYEEWLPPGYDGNRAYPVSVYLHGLMGLLNATRPGGYTSDMVGAAWAPRLLGAAAQYGFIVIAPNTRMLDGFYVNSKYTGPQEQDILDAAASVQARHQVSGVYLFGESMGTIGAYSLALHHPKLFRGVGIVNDCADVYAAAYWRILQHMPSAGVITLVTGGRLPNESAYAQSVFYYLSASRYFPQNLSGLRLYEANGGLDDRCPVSPTVWKQYLQGNNTLLVATCNTIAALHQPAGCTRPLQSLASQSPGQFLFRYDYVARGGHSMAILNAADMYSFWLGLVHTGLVCGGAGKTPGACP